MKRLMIGEILLDNNALTKEQLEKALISQKEQSPDQKRLGEILVENAIISQEVLFNSLAKQVVMACLPMMCQNKIMPSLAQINKSDNLDRYIKTMSFFIEMGILLSKNPKTTTLLGLITRQAPVIMEAERSSIFLLDKDENMLWSFIALGLDGYKINFDKNLGIAGHVLNSAKLMNIRDAYECPFFNKEIDRKTGYKTKSILCIPLINSKGKPFGVFQLLNKKTGIFTDEDEVLIHILASQVSIAFENINSWNELKSLKENLLRENITLRKQSQMNYGFSEIIGMNAKLMSIIETARQAARFNIPVTIEGDSGTGKELFAKAIHYNSNRADAPFVCVNCSAIPENLLESELFGYEKGAFSGAYSSKKGLFEEADTGTLFLDEIGDMDPRLQVKILRFLQTGEIQKLGSNKVKKVDVRIIAATNRNLTNLMKEGRFREDLYYRINVIPLHLPPLRERKDDIPLLIKHFLKKFGTSLNKIIKSLTPKAYDLLVSYDYPGNIRELENIIKRALVLEEGEQITIGHLPDNIKSSINKKTVSANMDSMLMLSMDYAKFKEIKTHYKKDLEETLDKKFINNLLKKAKGNVSNAARKAKMNRSLLHQMILKYKINARSYK